MRNRANHPASVKPKRPPLVAVIASRHALVRAIRLRRPPDFFELRLDALADSLGEIERALPRLRASLIITARHPAEGGLGNLGPTARRKLLFRFLPHAAMVDIELRSLPQMKAVVSAARRRRIDLMVSTHDLAETPLPNEFFRLTKAALAARPAMLKFATRTDTPEQLARLLDFFRATRRSRFPIAAMGIGQLGRRSRRELDRLGSALTYASLDAPNAEGQAPLGQLRRVRRAYLN